MGKNYNVFLSWSGERSKLVAEFMRGWLASVVQAAKPWMSESEIDKGTRNLTELSQALSDIQVGIVCLTPENLTKPWLLFEAGALSKNISDRTRLCTYLIGDLHSPDVVPPLGMFQDTKTTKEDTLRMIRTINRVVSEDPLADEPLVAVFNAMWPQLQERLQTLPAPSESLPAKRNSDEIMTEILELVRTQASQRERVQFMDAYIPTFQQFLPLLQQLVASAARSGLLPHHYVNTTVSVETPLKDGFANTFGFPKDLEDDTLNTPGHIRRHDLITVSATPAMVMGKKDSRMVNLVFSINGPRSDTDAKVAYRIDFMLERDTARIVAALLEQVAGELPIITR